VAMSHHDTRLRPPLPEASRLAILIHCWKPLSVFDQRPGPCHRLRREAGQVDRWQNPTCLHPLNGGKVKAWIVPGISFF
jgi:hypothetical protein